MGLKITVQLGQILDPNDTETKKPAISEELGAKTWVSRAKEEYCACHPHSTSQRGGQTP